MFADLRFAIRHLAKSRGFAVIAILTLALCIGANSAIFSAVRAILLKPYPWDGSERLVYCYNTYPKMGLENAGVSIPDYIDRRSGVSGFADSAIYHNDTFNLAGEGTAPDRIEGLAASASLFSTLSVSAARGRVFTDHDAQPGQDHVVVMNYTLWQQRYGGDPAIVGRTIRLNSEPYTVVGVMPEGFYFPSRRVQLWVPFTFSPAQLSDQQRGFEYSLMIARLKPGVSTAAVQRDLDVIEARNEERLPDKRDFWRSAGFGGRTVGFLQFNVHEIGAMLWLIQAGVAIALLIGCANVASLLLARTMAREQELAVRSALGASRGQLMRLLLIESVLLFVAGGTLGILFAEWGVAALGAFGFSGLPRATGVKIDGAVLAFTLACATGAGLLFGLLPAFSASRGNSATTLKEAGARGTAGHRTQRLRSLLVTIEIALAVMLLSTAGLLVKSFAHLREENPGFNTENVVTASVDLPHWKYDKPEKIVAFHDAVTAALQRQPGVVAVGATNVVPFSGDMRQGAYSSPDLILPNGSPLPHARVHDVDVGYLRAMGLTLLRGRWFAETDRIGSQNVCVVDQLLVNRYWPGQDVVGKRITRGPGMPGAATYTIVGVIAPIKTDSPEQTLSKETIYFPVTQRGTDLNGFLVRTTKSVGAIGPAIRQAVREADPDLSVFDLKTMDERIAEVIQPRRAPMLLISLFGALALLLATLGVYGVLAFSVTRRQRELGIRFALGATASDIALLVLKQAGRLVGIGIAAGFAGYLALSQIVGRLLYGVSPVDPAMLAIVPVVLIVAAFVASLVPVRRATRADPVLALKAE